MKNLLEQTLADASGYQIADLHEMQRTRLNYHQWTSVENARQGKWLRPDYRWNDHAMQWFPRLDPAVFAAFGPLLGAGDGNTVMTVGMVNRDLHALAHLSGDQALKRLAILDDPYGRAAIIATSETDKLVTRRTAKEHLLRWALGGEFGGEQTDHTIERTIRSRFADADAWLSDPDAHSRLRRHVGRAHTLLGVALLDAVDAWLGATVDEYHLALPQLETRDSAELQRTLPQALTDHLEGTGMHVRAVAYDRVAQPRPDVCYALDIANVRL